MDPRPENKEVSLREMLVALNEVSRCVATSLLEDEDLNRSIGRILAGVGRALGVSRALLCRYRDDGRTVLRTHEWSPKDGELHRREPLPQPSERFAWAHAELERGEALRVSDARTSAASMGSGLLGSDDRSMLVLPVTIAGKLDNLFAFLDTSPREWSDEIVSILQITVGAFARGIERKSAERARDALARELEEAVQREKAANRYKSEFLANMSHELRTPMNAIVGYAELLARPNVDRRTQETWISNLKRSTEYLLKLINDVLDLSKIEAGHMSLELAPCPLEEVVAGVQDLLAGVAAEKLLDLSVEVREPIPAVVETDPMRLEQILVNLVGNAVKFTERGSVCLALRISDDRTHLAFDVIDTGPGIAAESRRHLFRPFTQVHPSASGGTGLGLLISRHLARMLGGEITLESEVGQGSTFTLELPLEGASDDTFERIAPRCVLTAVRPTKGSLAGARVLIVDDSPDNREVLRFLLEEAGAICESAANGAVAVDLALSAQQGGSPFDVLLMDMSMPVLDGYEATRRLLERGLTAPILALTAFAMPGDRERSLEAGCRDYLTKPIVPSQLLATIEAHLRHDQDPVGDESDELVKGGQDPSFSLVGNPRFQRLIERYVASFPEQIAALREGLHAGELQTLRTRVHRLRGTAANYGFPGVSEAAGACEDAIRQGRPPEEVALALGLLIDCLSRAAAG